jgi:Multiubiquitin
MADIDAATQEQEQEHCKGVEIIVNGRPKEVTEKEISFEEVVNLAFNNEPPSGPDVVITVTYSKGEHPKEGSLLPGQSVKVKAGMVFNVTATDKS